MAAAVRQRSLKPSITHHGTEMTPRKVTFNIDSGLYADADAMKERLGHATFSALANAAVEEYVVRHGIQLHNEWREKNLGGDERSQGKAVELLPGPR